MLEAILAFLSLGTASPPPRPVPPKPSYAYLVMHHAWYDEDEKLNTYYDSRHWDILTALQIIHLQLDLNMLQIDATAEYMSLATAEIYER